MTRPALAGDVSDVKVAAKILFFLSAAWVGINAVILLADFARDVPLYFWSVVAAAAICVTSWRWLKRA